MHFSAYLTVVAAFASSAMARPAPIPQPDPLRLKDFGINPKKLASALTNLTGGQQDCMPREDAQRVAETFQSIIRGYTKEQALAALTPDFVDYSSAVSIIINRGGSGPEDITKPIFTSRDEFMEGHGTQEPIPFEIVKVWHSCEGVVSMVWRTERSGQGQETESAAVPVVGVAVLETEPTSMSSGIELERAQASGYNYRIHTLWSEFNTAAWLVNNGVFTPEAGVEVMPVPNEPALTKRSAPLKRVTNKFNVGMA